MTPAELAARRYFDAWTAPDRATRAALLEASFAAGGRIALGGRRINGRAAVLAAIEALHADPRQPRGRLTSAIDTMRDAFRFRAVVEYSDGRVVELLDVAEVDGDGRIAALYTFAEPLPGVGTRPPRPPGEPPAMTPTERAVRRYIDIWSERDPGARAALLEACFATTGRLVARGRTFHGRADLAAMADRLHADPRGFTVRVTSAIDAAGDAFRLGSRFGFADGTDWIDAVDVGEVDAEGRIAVLYAFTGPLADAPAP